MGTHEEVLSLRERAMELRRAERYDAAAQACREAVALARASGGPALLAETLTQLGNVERDRGDRDAARAAFVEARPLARRLGFLGHGILADVEGAFGLLASDEQDATGAEDAYRAALELATSAGSDEGVRTWARNLGNVLARTRRPREASEAYATALDAAVRTASPRHVVDVALMWSQTLESVGRASAAGEVLERAAAATPPSPARAELLSRAASAFAKAGEAKRAEALAGELDALVGNDPRAADLRARTRAMVDWALARDAAPAADEPRATLDRLLVERMARYTETNDLPRIVETAHLACDFAWGVGVDHAEDWKGMLGMLGIDLRIVGDAIGRLARAGRPEDALLLSQRSKGVAFAQPALAALRAERAPSDEAAAYLRALDDLSAAVRNFAASPESRAVMAAERVRSAGAQVEEQGLALRERDPLLAARLGVPVDIQTLYEFLPADRSLAVVDAFTAEDGLVMHVLLRGTDRVEVATLVAQQCLPEHIVEMAKVALGGHVFGAWSERQDDALLALGRAMHERFACGLAEHVSRRLVTQLVWIPDLPTRFTPLHLSFLCREKLLLPESPVPEPDALLLGEFFPVETAACLQAVAMSAPLKRPRGAPRVVSVADPTSDLPAARRASTWLAERAGKDAPFTALVGPDATKAALERALATSDVVVIGSHGALDVRDALGSHLRLADGAWTARDAMRLDLRASRPVVVLAACSVGAPAADGATGDAGLPAALLSAGAGAILSCAWPVEDVSMGYVVERFLHHLGHRGYRPSAALYRALRDLRALGREEALARCAALTAALEGAPDAEAHWPQIEALDALARGIRDGASERPFEAARFWGGITISGSGWHLPAGALVGDIDGIEAFVEAGLAVERAQQLVGERRFAEARAELEAALPRADGAVRARALAVLAWTTFVEELPFAARAARRKALRLVARAEAIARDDGGEAERKAVEDTRRAIMGAKL